MAGPNRGPTRSSDYRVLIAMATGACVLAAVSAVIAVVEHIVGVALIVAGLGWLAVAVLRRELRIRRRLADVAGTRPMPPRPRAGPGEHAPAPPAPTRLDPAADAVTHTGGTP